MPWGFPPRWTVASESTSSITRTGAKSPAASWLERSSTAWRTGAPHRIGPAIKKLAAEAGGAQRTTTREAGFRDQIEHLRQVLDGGAAALTGRVRPAAGPGRRWPGVAVSWPTEYGGGLSPIEQVVLAENSPAGARTRGKRPAIDLRRQHPDRPGFQAQKRHFLPRILNEHRWCQGFSRAGGGPTWPPDCAPGGARR